VILPAEVCLDLELASLLDNLPGSGQDMRRQWQRICPNYGGCGLDSVKRRSALNPSSPSAQSEEFEPLKFRAFHLLQGVLSNASAVGLLPYGYLNASVCYMISRSRSVNNLKLSSYFNLRPGPPGKLAMRQPLNPTSGNTDLTTTVRSLGVHEQHLIML
jgi:hypothetical protein